MDKKVGVFVLFDLLDFVSFFKVLVTGVFNVTCVDSNYNGFLNIVNHGITD